MIHNRHTPDAGSDLGLDPRLCHPSSAVMGMIPDVKAVLALRIFNCLVSGVRLGRYEGPLAVGLAEVDGAVALAGPHGPEVITPKGARLLRRMFEAGLIPQRRASSSKDLSVLDAYIAIEPDLLRRSAERLVATAPSSADAKDVPNH